MSTRLSSVWLRCCVPSWKRRVGQIYWPSPHVQHTWSDIRGYNGWCLQFNQLVRRVRAEARHPRSQHKWMHTKLWVVQRVFRTQVDASLGQLPLWKAAMPAVARSHVCGLIGAWAALQGVSTCNHCAFRVSPSALATVGSSSRLAGTRKGESILRGGVGSLASRTAPKSLLGKVVREVDAELTSDEGRAARRSLMRGALMIGWARGRIWLGGFTTVKNAFVSWTNWARASSTLRVRALRVVRRWLCTDVPHGLKHASFWHIGKQKSILDGANLYHEVPRCSGRCPLAKSRPLAAQRTCTPSNAC